MSVKRICKPLDILTLLYVNLRNWINNSITASKKLIFLPIKKNIVTLFVSVLTVRRQINRLEE